ncbi:EAL domain-containing protein [Solirubrobacter taibaiensis]|nr:EAL domain-containing protein [Solirubrobacter taibaiensis]
MGLRAIRKIEPIWGLIAVTSAISAILYFVFVRHSGAIQTPEIAWYVIALLVLFTERFPVELEFRRSSHSFSLTDIPLSVALVFTTGSHAFWAIVGGSLIALALRRMPIVKFFFNVAQLSLATTVMLVIVHFAAQVDDGFGFLTWGSVLLATQLGGVLTIAQILAAIVLTEGHVSRDQVRQMFGMDFVVTLTGTAMALVSSILWIERPEAVLLLLVPILVAFMGYRAYVHERQGHEKVKFLYEANRTLSESPEVAIALEGLLERALEAFRAEQAEVILFAGDGGAPLRTGLGPGTAREAMAPMDHDAANALRELAEGTSTAVALMDPLPGGTVGAYLAERGIRHGMLGVLRGEDRVIGTLMLANRYGLTRGFTGGDRALFETLAANASAALQFDRLEQAVTDLRELQDQLTHQAHHDPLTGLANRALFSQRVREALEPGGAGKVAVMFIDLDDFKGVNDTLGHAIGDELLRGVASRLVGSTRRQDVVARLGGDEFAVLVQRDEHVEQGAIELAERTLDSFLAPVQAGEKPLNVSLSIGIAAAQSNRTATDELLRDADVAMYEAKEGGKRRFAVFTPEMRDSIVRRHDLKEELANAIKNRDLVVQYQPIVDIQTGQAISVEALVRWNHADRGRIPPMEFIPLAEDTGLIVPLGRYVLEEACASVVQRSDTLQVQVNLSAIELEHPDLLHTITDVLQRTGIAPGRLVLEVTETLLVKDAERGAETLQQLRDLGVQLALDDFGTGYSSLSYLRNLPLDTLKIAREFVEGLAFSEHDAAFVRLIVGLAKTVGLKVVAEGIETRAQLDMLREIGCDLGQGYYFAAPMDVDADWVSAPVAAALV